MEDDSTTTVGGGSAESDDVGKLGDGTGIGSDPPTWRTPLGPATTGCVMRAGFDGGVAAIGAPPEGENFCGGEPIGGVFVGGTADGGCAADGGPPCFTVVPGNIPGGAGETFPW